MQSLGEAGWKNSQLIFVNLKKLLLFIYIFAGNSNHSKKKKIGTTVDALGKEDDDDKGVVMWQGPQHPQAGCKGKGSKSQMTRKQVRK